MTTILQQLWANYLYILREFTCSQSSSRFVVIINSRITNPNCLLLLLSCCVDFPSTSGATGSRDADSVPLVATGLRPIGRLQRRLEMLDLGRRTSVRSVDFSIRLSSSLPHSSPVAHVTPIQRPDLPPISPPFPSPLDQPKVFRPSYGTSPGYGLAYAIDVCHAYTFLAPGRYPDLEEPSASLCEQQLFDFQQRVNRVPPRLTDALSPFLVERLRPFAHLLPFQLALPFEPEPFAELSPESYAFTRNQETPLLRPPPDAVLRPFLRYDIPRFDNSLPSPNRRLKIYRPPFGFTPGSLPGYEAGVRDAYDFLAPGYFPRVGDPFRTLQEQTEYYTYERELDAAIVPSLPPPPLNQIDAPLEHAHMVPFPIPHDDEDEIWD